MAEIITEEQPRIKYTTHYAGPLGDVSLFDSYGELAKLSALMSEMEALGAAPILNDGQVAGNCAISPRYLLSSTHCTADGADGAAGGGAAAGAVGAAATAAEPAAAAGAAGTRGADTHSLLQSGLALVSMSGKPPGHRLDPARDFVLVAAFDRPSWSAAYRCANRQQLQQQRPSQPTAATAASDSRGSSTSASEGAAPQQASASAAPSSPAAPAPAAAAAASGGGGGGGSSSCSCTTVTAAAARVRPSSDSPLLAAALSPGAAALYGWGWAPAVVLHGHALAEGEGLTYAAEELGLPISQRATLFSTPEDLFELEAVFRSHPYPRHRCYIRRGHGFFLLADSVDEARQHFERLIVPWLHRCRQQQQQQQQQ